MRLRWQRKALTDSHPWYLDVPWTEWWFVNDGPPWLSLFWTVVNYRSDKRLTDVEIGEGPE